MKHFCRNRFHNETGSVKFGSCLFVTKLSDFFCGIRFHDEIASKKSDLCRFETKKPDFFLRHPFSRQKKLNNFRFASFPKKIEQSGSNFTCFITVKNGVFYVA